MRNITLRRCKHTADILKPPICVRLHRVQVRGPDAGQVDAFSVRAVGFELGAAEAGPGEEGGEVSGVISDWISGDRGGEGKYGSL